MRRLCKVVSSSSGSGDRRTSKSSREYHPLVTNQTPLSPLPHGSTFIICCSVENRDWTDIDVFKGIPRTESIAPYVRFVVCLRYALSCSFQPFQGTSSPPPSNVRIGSSVLDRREMAANGSVAWTASLNKSIASSTHLSVSTLFMPREWLRMHANPAPYIILQASAASRRSSETCCGVPPVAMHGDMTTALTAFVFRVLSWYCGRCPTYVFYQWGPEISNDPELRHRAHFQAWALGETDKHEEGDNPKYWTLDSLMKLNGACSRSHSPIPFRCERKLISFSHQ